MRDHFSVLSIYIFVFEGGAMSLLESLNDEIQALKEGERLVKRGVPDTLYHAADGIGSSLMREATKSMAHYHLSLTSERKQTASMAIGSAVHCLVLEPDDFFERFVIQPAHLKPGNSTEWQTWKRAQTKNIITRCELDTITQTAEAVMDRAAPYFVKGDSELSYWYRDESGLILKARLDYKQGDLGIDLKTTNDDTARRFSRTVKYDYAVQDSLYRRVSGLSDFIFIGVCTSAPHSVYACKQSEKNRAYAEDQINRAIEAILIAQEFDDYPLAPIELIETE
jgi:hypothetical protein